MLPTNKKAKIGDIIQCSNPHSSRMAWKNKLGICSFDVNAEITSGDEWLAQHLYIISKEETKNGELIYDSVNTYIPERIIINHGDDGDGTLNNKNGYFPVIATTNKSLKIGDWIHNDSLIALPEPSQSFIQKYVSKYNEGNEIKEVMVEYEEYHGISQSIAEIYAVSESDNGRDYDKSFDEKLNELGREYKLKVNPNDNTITIKKIKDTWNREEVMELLNKCWIQATKKTIEPLTESGFSKWIGENL